MKICCTSMKSISSCETTFQRGCTGLRLVTVEQRQEIRREISRVSAGEAISAQWTHFHVQEASLRWSELCRVVSYLAGSSHQKTGTHWFLIQCDKTSNLWYQRGIFTPRSAAHWIFHHFRTLYVSEMAVWENPSKTTVSFIKLKNCTLADLGDFSSNKQYVSPLTTDSFLIGLWLSSLNTFVCFSLFLFKPCFPYDNAFICPEI